MEKKIKNVNKAIMVIVAILLTLVLISTSTVSGIFAKYVITKDATTVVSLKKFGVKLDMKKGSDFETSGASATIADDGTTATVTISGISLVPGSDYSDIVNFTASVVGTVSVNTRIKVKAEVIAPTGTNLNKFKDGSTVYIPIAATAKVGTSKDTATESTISAAWVTSFDTYQTNITAGLKSAVGTITGESTWAGTKIATAGESSLDQLAKAFISFGFEVPETHGSGTAIATYDERITKIAENQPSFSIKYYVSLEQIV